MATSSELSVTLDVETWKTVVVLAFLGLANVPRSEQEPNRQAAVALLDEVKTAA